MSQSNDPYNPFAESERSERRSGCIVVSLALGSILLIGGLFLMWQASQPSPLRAIFEDDPTSEPTRAQVQPTRTSQLPTPRPIGTGEPVTIRWWVGFAAGNAEGQRRVVDEFNESHPHIRLELEVAESTSADDGLETMLAEGRAPDITGPTSNLIMYRYQDYWLDLDPLVAEADYDLSAFHPAMVDYYRIGADDTLVALPFAIYPSALWYNKDLFDEADLAYPPHEYGAPYIAADGSERVWDIDTMEMLARELTLDADGRTANDPDFDPTSITQFGLDMQWTVPLGQATLFGAGSLTDESGQVSIPTHWRDFWHWQYAAIWDDHFMPSNEYILSDLLNAGNAFSSGNIAMMPQQLWYVCCVERDDWDVAAMPEYEGTATAKLHADTFLILNQTEHPREAFEVLTYLIERDDLIQVYGGFPARTSQQPDFLELLQIVAPDVDFEVFERGLDHIDTPNHESGLAAQADAEARLREFQDAMLSSPDLDLDAEIDELEADLQAILDALPENNTSP